MQPRSEVHSCSGARSRVRSRQRRAGAVSAGILLAVSLGCGGGEPASGLIINEFLASNDTVLADSTGDFSDWVELRNTSGAPFDIAGWTISDGNESFTFPVGTRIDEFLVLFASGEVARASASEVHLPFKLKAGGEQLILTDADGAVSDPSFDEYPEQNSDISYGVDDAGELQFFSEPTPGQPNG